MQAIRAGQRASLHPNHRRQAGSYKVQRLEFVGACLQAIRTGQRASLHPNHRRQAGSYRGSIGL